MYKVQYGRMEIDKRSLALSASGAFEPRVRLSNIET